ncbi:MAG: hypothetical protein ACTSRK_03680 [Promethearchaeota archaeon]
MELYFFPSIPDPLLIFDYSKQTGFFIDFSTYQITLNLANTPEIFLDQEYYEYFFSLSLHEISHYIICPYDNITNMKLIAAVLRAQVYKYYAPIIVNIFSDLLIDYKNHLRYPEIMEWELGLQVSQGITPSDQSPSSSPTSSPTSSSPKTPKKPSNSSPPQPSTKESTSDLWKLLCRAYEIMWEKDFLPDLGVNSILEEVTKKVCHLVQKSLDHEDLWEKNLTKIAKLLIPILKNECQVKNESGPISTSPSGRPSKGGESQQFPQSPLELPDDVSTTFGNYTEIPNYDQIKEGDDSQTSTDTQAGEKLENNLQVIAQEESFGNFQAIANLFGYQDPRTTLALWYRGRAKNLIKIEIVAQKEGGSIPVYPIKWRLGDPLEKLDPIQTLITSPVIIPNITTKQWVNHQGPGIDEIQQLPDLMIVLDSSGSMTWNFNKKSISGRYHISLLASFAAMQYAIKQGAFISVINFSDRCRYVEWTNNQYEIEQTLLSYQGSGTILPSERMLRIAKKATRPSCIMVITDFEIGNWDQAYHDFMKLLALGNKIICFFIGGREKDLESEELKRLQSMGTKFYCISKKRDLVGLVIREIHGAYHPTS